MTTENKIFKLQEDVLYTEFEGEAILLHLDTGIYYGLDEIGTTVVTLIGQGESLDKVIDLIYQEYEVNKEQIRKDVEELIEDLHRENLIVHLPI